MRSAHWPCPPCPVSCILGIIYKLFLITNPYYYWNTFLLTEESSLPKSVHSWFLRKQESVHVLLVGEWIVDVPCLPDECQHWMACLREAFESANVWDKVYVCLLCFLLLDSAIYTGWEVKPQNQITRTFAFVMMLGACDWWDSGVCWGPTLYFLQCK